MLLEKVSFSKSCNTETIHYNSRFITKKKKDKICEASINEEKEDEEKQSIFFTTVVDIAKEKQIDCQINRHWFYFQNSHIRHLSMHQLMLSFLEINKSTAEEFTVE